MIEVIQQTASLIFGGRVAGTLPSSKCFMIKLVSRRQSLKKSSTPQLWKDAKTSRGRVFRNKETLPWPRHGRLLDFTGLLSRRLKIFGTRVFPLPSLSSFGGSFLIGCPWIQSSNGGISKLHQNATAALSDQVLNLYSTFSSKE